MNTMMSKPQCFVKCICECPGVHEHCNVGWDIPSTDECCVCEFYIFNVNVDEGEEDTYASTEETNN